MRSLKVILNLFTLIILMLFVTETVKSLPPTHNSMQTDTRGLEPGAVIERALAAGQSHAYQLRLASGQFLHTVIKQRGIDVSVTVLAPDGQRFITVDRNEEEGLEPVLMIAEMSGVYRFVVSAANKEGDPGRYDIRIAELREATAQDRKRVAADRTVAEGERLHGAGTEESLRKALEKYEEALPLFRAADDKAGEAVTLDNLGRAYVELGDSRKALEYFNQAIPLFRALGDREGEAGTINNIGAVYDDLGEKQKALEYFRQVLPLFRAAGLRGSEAITLNNIGFIYQSLGEHQKALWYYRKALPLRRLAGDRQGEGNTLYNLAKVYFEEEEHQRALIYYNQALIIFRALEDRRGEADSLSSIGVVYRRIGNHKKALEYLDQVLPLFKTAGDRRGEATALHNMGTVYASLGQNQKALSYYNQALSLSRSLWNQSGEAFTLAAIARVERDSGNLIAARQHIEAALDTIESLRAKVAGQELRASYFASKQSDYEFYIDLLMQLNEREPAKGYDRIALEASERARARTLLELLAEARTDIRQGVAPALLEVERLLRQQINASEANRMQLLSNQATPEQANAAQKEIEALLTEYQEVRAQIRATSPRYAALTEPVPLGLQEIQQLLDEETLLLEFALGDERSYLWAVTPASVASFTLPPRAAIEAAALRAYQLLTTSHRREFKVQAELAAADLSRLLLGPVANQLGKKRLVFVSNGALQYVPFAALPTPEGGRRGGGVEGRKANSLSAPHSPPPLLPPSRPLVADHEIVSLPSASVLAVLRRETAQRQAASKTVAVFADPVFQSDDTRVRQAIAKVGATARVEGKRSQEEAPLTRSVRELGMSLERLRYTRQEAEAIAALAPEGKALKALDFEADRAQATGAELSQYAIVHFATHGLINNQHPELSGVVLSLVDAQGKPKDGFLRLHDIYNLKLGADLVVLSACQTALGKNVKGEGLIGLTRGFMHAGAARVVASLWDVRDEATAELMKRFYEGMLKGGLRPTAALKAAQLSMLKERRWEAPYYWAGFVLQGEWK